MRNIKLTLIIIGAVLVIPVGWLYISSKNAPIQKRPLPTKSEVQLEKAPNFKLLDYDGKTVSLADFAGKPLIINSWAAWCPFCKKELVDFAAVQKEFGNAAAIIAINRGEARETAKKYTDELGVTNDLIFLLDPSDSFYQSIEGFSMPETIFVDKNGNIVEHKRGPMDINEIRQKIQKLLSL
jgi:thiol-disulfide isomerase/thioredoxin